MKKSYIKPSMKVFAIKATTILAGSPSKVSNEVGNGTQLGKLFDDDWDDDQE